MGNNLKNQHYKNMGIMPQMLMYPFEAESVAYIVCEHYGFDSEDYSFPYIVGWVGTGFQDILKESMSTIQKTADEIITGVNQYFENNKN